MADLGVGPGLEEQHWHTVFLSLCLGVEMRKRETDNV